MRLLELRDNEMISLPAMQYFHKLIEDIGFEISILGTFGSLIIMRLQSRLGIGKCPREMKKASVVLIHKKGDKQPLKNYRTILLKLLEKLLERLLYVTECLRFLQKIT